MQDDKTPDDSARAGEESGQESADKPRTKMKPRQIISSVFAAGLGVQSSKNRERDFSEGSAGAFIAAGLIFTALFIGGVYLLVQIVLKSAG